MNFHNNGREYDVAVVGGGLAGLTAATYLARAGRHVILFEKGRDVGGRAQTRQQDQFLFNLGPHALYNGAEAQEVLNELGVPFQGGTAPAIQALVMKDNELYQVPAGPRSFMRNELFSMGERLELVRALLGVMRADPVTAARQSTEAWIREHATSEGVRHLLRLLMRVGVYSNASHELSAEVFLRQVQLGFRHGVLYLDGGWQTLVGGLRRVAQEAGVQIQTRSRVERLTDGGAGPVLTLADGRSVSTTAAILAVGPQAARQLLPQDQVLARAGHGMRPVRAAALDVALSRLPQPERPLVFGLQEPLYLSVHSTVAKLAPEGGALLHLAKYLKHDEEVDRAEEELEGLLDLAQPGWRNVLVHRRFVPDLTVVHNLVTPPQGLRGRPAVDAPETPGVFLAGDWVGSVGWLADAALASARAAARMALQRRTVRIDSEAVRRVSRVYT